MRDALFSWIASNYPTHRISTSHVLGAVWRVLFYSIRPKKKFVMRTPHYRLVVYPVKGTLTRSIIRRGDWEAAESAAFRSNLKPGGFVIDVGANFGHYSLLASNVVGPDGLVVAFEPNPASYTLLSENVALLPCRNVRTEQAGLSDQNGTMTLSLDAYNPGGHSFSGKNVREPGGSVDVPVYTIDLYLEERGITKRLDLIKIDVEGFEFKVLKGAGKTIERDRPVVFCEVSPQKMKNVDDDYRDLLEMFKSRNYTVHLMNKVAVLPLSWDEADALLRGIGAEYADLLFVPPAG